MKYLVKKRLYFLLLLFLSVPSCANFNVTREYVLDKDKDVGILVMSINHNTDTITLRYGNKSNSETGAIMTSTIYDAMDFRQPKGRLVVIELPSGGYEFYQWETYFKNIRYTSAYISAPFFIEKGKVTYIGNLHIYAELVNPVSTYIGVKSELVFTDKSERDIPLLKKKYPKLDIDNLSKKISQINEVKSKGAVSFELTGPHRFEVH